MSNTHVVIAGDVAAEFDRFRDVVRLRGITVTEGDDSDVHTMPVTMFIIATRFSAAMDWDAWWGRDAHNQKHSIRSCRAWRRPRTACSSASATPPTDPSGQRSAPG